KIRFPKRRSFRELRLRRCSRRITGGTAFRHPVLNQLNLIFRKDALAEEKRIGRIGRPWRHVARLGGSSAGLLLLQNIFISQQWKRPRFTRTMTRRAVLKNDRSDVLIKCWVRVDGVRLAGGENEKCDYNREVTQAGG